MPARVSALPPARAINGIGKAIKGNGTAVEKSATADAGSSQSFSFLALASLLGLGVVLLALSTVPTRVVFGWPVLAVVVRRRLEIALTGTSIVISGAAVFALLAAQRL